MLTRSSEPPMLERSSDPILALRDAPKTWSAIDDLCLRRGGEDERCVVRISDSPS